MKKMLQEMYFDHNVQKVKNEFSSLWYGVKYSSHFVSLLIRYSISGLFVGIFYVFFGYLLSKWVGLSLPISVTLSYIVTTPVAFTLQKRFTFKSDRALSKELPRFILVGFILLAMSSATQTFVTLPMPLMLQLFAFWMLSSLLNFLAYKFWVFSQDE
jgi:putative flippase GtrA